MKTTDPCISIGGPGCGIKKSFEYYWGKMEDFDSMPHEREA